MNKNLMPKISFIVILVALAIITLSPPSETLKPGIDLAGGTSLIYEINTEGLTNQEKDNLSTNMITVLKRRVDPANVQNLIWRPQGNTRFEIQMPLASKEVTNKRQAYEDALETLLSKNVQRLTVLRALKAATDKRASLFEQFSQGDPNRVEILSTLAEAYDQREAMRQTRDAAKINVDQKLDALEEDGVMRVMVENLQRDWIKMDRTQLEEALAMLPGNPDPNAISEYLADYRSWADTVNQLTAPDTGLNVQYDQAVAELDKLNLTNERITSALGMLSGRDEALADLRNTFTDRVAEIDAVIAAYDEYSPMGGHLDDPEDLKRMLKGAGILEFRILPTAENGLLTQTRVETYRDALKNKGPRSASDNEFVWCPLEDNTPESVYGWINSTRAIIGEFGQKYYVLACNQPDKSMVHSGADKGWKLEKARPSMDNMGRNAIAFTLDDKGGMIFRKITSANINSPLCILLDNQAISAPGINTAIGKNGQITGTFTQTEVTDMVNKLNAGSLPGRLVEQPISEKTIGPSIGADNRDQGIKAGFLGLGVVIAVMALYYLAAGLIADLALVLNILFVLAIMALIDATFTLPGIAGIILTIGMSVDANVLIFERIREEQGKGSSLGVAIKNGYDRAFRTIFDANLTTFITGAILYWVASEEVKGFAIVLMLGIISSMFTALFITRVIFEWLLQKKMIKENLKMNLIISEPKINWMAMRPVFMTVSGVLIVLGLGLFFKTSTADKYDIEFTGGTSVQINLKEGSQLTIDDVRRRIVDQGLIANVYSIGEPNSGQFEITTTETNRTTSSVTFSDTAPSREEMTKAIKKAELKFDGTLSHLDFVIEEGKPVVVSTSQANVKLVQHVLESAFATAQIGTPVVEEVVNKAIQNAFEDELAIQRNLQPEIVSITKIDDSVLEAQPALADMTGGIKIVVKLAQAATLDQISERLGDLRFKPDMTDLIWYPFQLLGMDLDQPTDEVTSFLYVSTPPDAGLRELSTEEWQRYQDNEEARVLNAASLETSLPRVTQIDPSVGGEQMTRALIAIVLSLCAIIGYIWIRFGNVRYGVAAIVALVHDVSITLGAVIACGYISGTSISELLLIGDFKINLAMIAAFLTLIGYSLNDTIVVFDRIRENRAKAQMTGPDYQRQHQPDHRPYLDDLTAPPSWSCWSCTSGVATACGASPSPSAWV